MSRRGMTTQSYPGGSSQSRFRVNPKPTYSERMSQTRAEIRSLIQVKLRDITLDDTATMRYPTFWRDVTEKYHVIVEGWPRDIPFKNLSDLSNVQVLETLLQGWQSGTIRFRRITDAEFRQLAEARRAQQAALQQQGIEQDEGADEDDVD
ncbi:hypothetical protein CERSUDRAFT_112677 [Gelatoporia subvermispora B]|uniref:Uncharacterized protein n=1 Tax=Ceriporiopsis subvermispora (strain B) TaxID=914234 RepID=M2QPJ9_CERS8|nr:hypothetical protein CERSUDRAFT_112677 [Gelatoporia subvermispora B]